MRKTQKQFMKWLKVKKDDIILMPSTKEIFMVDLIDDRCALRKMQKDNEKYIPCFELEPLSYLIGQDYMVLRRGEVLHRDNFDLARFFGITNPSTQLLITERGDIYLFRFGKFVLAKRKLEMFYPTDMAFPPSLFLNIKFNIVYNGGYVS